ncbi:MAG: preprotein translocase subunit SecG [Candidatus Thiodiazotropha sp. (ex Epidulcina cf. delphinae)]|nr:preprotein translocase subunit SecG [Candidatus Thiodiazotropha sp. (ex Epidulcina cf. delphinae)]
MQTLLTVFHLFLAVGLVGLILIQHGKGADMGAAFGSGASGTVFGAKGSASFLTRTTAVLATLFFVTSMVMAYFASQGNEPEGVMEAFEQSPAVQVEAPPQSDIPPIPMGGGDVPDIAPVAESVDAVPVPGVDDTVVSDTPEPAEE